MARVVILRQHQAPGTFTLVAFLGPEAKVAAATVVTVTSFNVCNKTRRKGHDLAGLFPEDSGSWDGTWHQGIHSTHRSITGA